MITIITATVSGVVGFVAGVYLWNKIERANDGVKPRSSFY